MGTSTLVLFFCIFGSYLCLNVGVAASNTTELQESINGLAFKIWGDLPSVAFAPTLENGRPLWNRFLYVNVTTIREVTAIQSTFGPTPTIVGKILFLRVSNVKFLFWLTFWFSSLANYNLTEANWTRFNNNITIGNQTVPQLFFNTTLDNGAHFAFLFQLFEDATTLPYGDTNITTLPQSGKASVFVDDWPFQNTSNYLQVIAHYDMFTQCTLTETSQGDSVIAGCQMGDVSRKIISY
jgi:hypothetical protein